MKEFKVIKSLDTIKKVMNGELRFLIADVEEPKNTKLPYYGKIVLYSQEDNEPKCVVDYKFKILRNFETIVEVVKVVDYKKCENIVSTPVIGDQDIEFPTQELIAKTPLQISITQSINTEDAPKKVSKPRKKKSVKTND